MRPINMIDLRGIDLNLLVSLDCSPTKKLEKKTIKTKKVAGEKPNKNRNLKGS